MRPLKVACILSLLLMSVTWAAAGPSPHPPNQREKPSLVEPVTSVTASPQFPGGAGTDEWEFVLAPYLYLAPLDGNVSRGGLTADVDVSVAAALENLEFGGAARFEARRGRWGGLFDFFFMGVGGEGNLPLGQQLDVDVDLLTVESALSYRLGPPERAFELLAGLRYTRQDYEARIVGDTGPRRRFTPDWFDPIVGGRLTASLSDRVLFLFRGDIGGFGAGSDFTWNIETGLGFRLSRRAELQVQFKALGVDYEEGVGRDFYAYDVVSPGVVIAIPIHF